MDETQGNRFRARLTLALQAPDAAASADHLRAALARRLQPVGHLGPVRLLGVEQIEILQAGGAPIGEAAAPFSGTHSLDAVAAMQGVSPVTRFESLLGTFWPEDEEADEVVATIRAWRRDGG